MWTVRLEYGDNNERNDTMKSESDVSGYTFGGNTSDTGELRPFETWTMGYVRKMIKHGRITRDEVSDFVSVWNGGNFCDRLTVDELYKGK